MPFSTISGIFSRYTKACDACRLIPPRDAIGSSRYCFIECCITDSSLEFSGYAEPRRNMEHLLQIWDKSEARYGSQGTPWLRMQFSGSCDRCVLVGRHTHMPASHYPLQRAGVDVVHPDFPILSRYRDEVPIHAHVFDALAPSATNSSFESASLRIKHIYRKACSRC